MRVVIITDKQAFLDYRDNLYHKDDVVIPIGPISIHNTIENNWTLRTLGSLFSRDEYFRAKVESENRIKKLINELNNYSESVALNFPLKIGDYFHFQLWVTIGQIHYNRFIIESIMKNLKPESVVLFKYRKLNTFMDFRPDPANVLQEVFSHSNFSNNLDIKIRYIKRKKINDNLIRQNILNILPSRIKEILRSYRVKWKIKNYFSFNTRSLLLLGAPYDWTKVLSSKKFKSSFFVKHISGQVMESSTSYDTKIMEILNKSITYDGKCVYDLDRQVRKIQGSLLAMDSKVKQLNKKITHIKAILSSVFVFPWQNFIGHLAIHNKIPIINWQHGVMNLFEDPFVKAVETRYTTHYFCFGDGVAPKYEKWIGRSPMQKVYTVGSTGKTIVRQNSQYILYATGKWKKTATPIEITPDPDTRLYYAQKDILGFLEEIGTKHEVIFKKNNSPGLNEIPFVLKNIKIEQSKPFPHLLSNAKLALLDTPSTTCIETCSTSVPLFVLTGRDPWYSEPTKLLQKRAVLADTTADLIRHIKNYLQNGEYGADRYNTEFLEKYGSKFTVEQTKHNVLTALDEIIPVE